MPSKNWNILKIVVFGMACLVLMTGSGRAQERSWRDLPAEAYRPGHLVIIPKAGQEAALGRWHRARGATVRAEFPALARIQSIELPAGADTLAAVEAYQRSGLVDVAEPDILFRPAAVPNDPFVLNGEQWALNNTGQSGGLPDADIDGPEAWDKYSSASNVVVAVVDAGVRYTHEDLAANMWVNPGEIPGNGIDDDANGYVDDIHGINAQAGTGQPLDELGHGTHVAGIIGAVGNNGVGGCGVAWRVRIMACRFLSAGQPGTLQDLLNCFSYAQAKGAKVMNLSFTTTTYSTTLSNALWTLRNAGILIAAAAGNDGSNNDTLPVYPAGFQMDNLVAVTSTTRTDGFSGHNYGATSVHLAAPGVDIYSTYNTSDSAYMSMTGTSMASPYVAGAMALIRARYPQLTHQQVIARVLSTVDPLPALAGRCITGGRLNLDRAVGPRDFAISTGTFAWVPTNGMTPLTLDNNGVSAALPLGFSFSYYGQAWPSAYVAANGMIGFEAAGLNAQFEANLPAPGSPNNMICPYWDDLNPAGGGRVWTGTIGVAPHRKFVVSWVDVPHSVVTGGETRFTLQALLHETGEITFQYLDVQNGRSVLNSGRSATVGVEDPQGQTAVLYSYHGTQALITNGLAVVLTPQGNPVVAPGLTVGRVGPGLDSVVNVSVFGQPAQRCILESSPDAGTWSPIATNALPATGKGDSAWPLNGAARFYRARIER